MENYAAAYEARLSDVETLLAPETPRAVAAVHLGGVAVECRLKALAVTYHKITEWGQEGARARDPWKGKSIARPGHSLVPIVKLMNELYQKAKNDARFLTHLDALVHPTGATQVDFIDLRYAGDEVERDALQGWRRSFEYVCGWLDKNGKVAS